jgi:apolipoprotein N-acyltransferase
MSRSYSLLPLLRDLAIVAMAGALLTLAFPFYNVWPLSCVALAPLLLLLGLQPAGTSWRRVFLLAFVFGTVWHTSAVWWVGYVTVAGMLALTLLIGFLLAGMLTTAWLLLRRGIPLLVAVPACWLVFEAITTYFLGGFPWLLLGISWRPLLLLTQISDVTGVYGVSLLIVLINCALTMPALALLRRRAWRGACGAVVLVALLCGAAALYGHLRLRQLDAQTPRAALRVACVQANIPSLVKHDTTRDADILRRHAALTRRAARLYPDLIIWPETALPGYFFEQGLAYHITTNLVRQLRMPILTGMARYTTDLAARSIRYFNGAGIIEPDGIVRAVYDKMHLVMFGEYVPFERYLPFLSLVTPIEGSYTPGAQTTLLVVSNRQVQASLGPLICFEDAFGWLARRMTRAGADVLVNLTNDGWFRSSPQPYQHAALAGFRAIEMRRPLIRATNSGVTLVVDRGGRETAVLEQYGRRTQIDGVLFDVVAIHAPVMTVYARYGDWLLLPALLVIGACFLWSGFGR